MGASWTWDENHLRKLFDHYVPSGLPLGLKVVIFVDALDEAECDLARSLSKDTQTIGEHRRRVRVCVASWPFLPSVGTLYREFQYDYGVILDHENTRDIKLYLDLAFENVNRKQLYVLKDELCSKANGLFQWVKWSAQMARALLDDDGEETSYVLAELRKVPEGA